MTTRIGGNKRKSRAKLKKGFRSKGKLSIKKYFQEFEMGTRVALLLDSSVHMGEFHPRFHGKSGIINGKKGECYEIAIKDGNKMKTVIVHPIHLRGM